MLARIPAPVFGAFALFAGLSTLMVSGVVLPFDEAILRWVGGVRDAGVTDAALLASFAADGTPIVIAGLGICALLWQRAGRRTALGLLLAGVTGELVYVIAKASFARPRPDVIERLGSAGWHAYPSGHTMMATIIYGLAFVLLAGTTRGVLRTVFLVLACVIPVAVGASRVVLGVHYPSDVLAGLTLGVAWLVVWRDWAARGDDGRRLATTGDG